MSDCIFCKIVNKQIPKVFEYEDSDVLAFEDVNPKSKVHMLIIPKKHIVSISTMDEKDIEVVGKLFYTAKKIAEKLGVAKSGYKLIINNGRDGGQIIDHIHVHLLGGERIQGIV